MAIAHSTFLTQVRNYTEVDNTVLTDSIIQEFIRIVELNVAGTVDYDDLRKYDQSAFTSGNRALSLPSDCMIVRSLQTLITTTVGSTTTTTRTFLEKRDTSFISEYNPTNTTGAPIYWAAWDEFNVIVAPTPAAAYVVQLNFIKTPPNFTSTTTTYLSKYQEGMLLHGVLAECFRYLKGPQDMLQLYETKYKEELQNFALQQMGRRRRGEYDDGVPRIVIPSPSPNQTGS